MSKTYIIDTNVLLSDPNSLFSFDENEIILPFTVIEEIDKIKKRPNEVGANAREIARQLSEMISENDPGSLQRGLKLRNGSTLRIVSLDDIDKKYTLDGDWDSTNKDNHILQICRGLNERAKEQKKELPTLVTRDIVLRVKCDFLGIPCQDYKKESVADNPDRLFSGACEATVPPEVMEAFWEEQSGEMPKADFNCIVDSYVDHKLSPNEFITLKQSGLDEGCIVRYKGESEPLRVVRENKKPVFNVTPRNKEQSLAMDLLLDPDIKMVTLIGRAGSGKTICSIAAGLNQVLEKKKYKSLVVCRPVVPVGNDIGYLPGPVPLTSRILTPSGWTTMGEIKKGDLVVSVEGTPTEVLGVFPKGSKEILEISFEDGAKVECCEDHPWAVYKVNDKKRRVMQTKEIEAVQNGLGWTKKWWNRLYIDVAQPVQYEPSHRALPIHPYVLGSILGDGCISNKYANEFSTADSETIDRLNSFLPDTMEMVHKGGMSYSFTMKENKGRSSRNPNILSKEINALGLRGLKSRTKHIPDSYLLSSVSERLLLLQGLMDTDGYVSRDGKDVSFSTTSPRLAKQVKDLVLSLGGMASVNPKPKKHDSFEVSISFAKEEMCPFLLERKAARWKPRVHRINRRIESVVRTGRFTEMQCISVAHKEHLYLMDHFVVTHNTKEEKLEPWIAPIKDNLRYLLFSGKRTKNAETTLQSYFEDGVIEVEAITYLRGRSIADAFIIIDEAQNLTAHELKTIITRVGENTKIILTGDIEQIDNLYIDALNNGLTIAVEKFRNYPIAGHITLLKGERSALASLAAKIL